MVIWKNEINIRFCHFKFIPLQFLNLHYMKLLFVSFYLIICTFINTPDLTQKNDLVDIWYKRLPQCPCKNPDLNGVKINDGWAKDKGNLDKYHRGATASYRSYPYVKTSAGKSGQQCCYDTNGDLITEGRAAGTPDKISTCKGENSNGFMKVRTFSLLKHFSHDVKPWTRFMKNDEAGWNSYNQLWLPNKGNRCKVNAI